MGPHPSPLAFRAWFADREKANFPTTIVIVHVDSVTVRLRTFDRRNGVRIPLGVLVFFFNPLFQPQLTFSTSTTHVSLFFLKKKKAKENNQAWDQWPGANERTNCPPPHLRGGTYPCGISGTGDARAN